MQTIDTDALFHELGYSPHSPVQREVHFSDARFRIVCCGRRWGKSTWAGHELTKKMFVPDSLNWIVGPNYGLGEKEFRVVWNDFKKLGLLGDCAKSYNKNQGSMRIHWRTMNSTLEVKSAERPDSLVGDKLNHVCMSEAAKHKLSTWQMYVQPGLSDLRGTADFPSTPEGYNWYEAMFQLGQQDASNVYKSWQLPSWTNPVLFPLGYDDPEIARLRKELTPQYFAQEIGAEFTVFEGKIYDNFHTNSHVRPLRFNPSWPNYLALDFGFTDPFVCLDIQVNPVSQRIHVWREYQVTQKSTTEHAYDIASRINPEGYRVDGTYADPRGADEIATLQMIWGGIAEPHVVGWLLGIEAVKQAMMTREDGMPGILIDPSCVHLIRQLKGLRAKIIREGHNERQGQHDYDDHGPDALRYFFNEHIVLGGGYGLADLYGNTLQNSEAAEYFNTINTEQRLGLNSGYSPVGHLGF